MGVLGYQVLFFLLILFSALFGRKTRNLAIIGSIIFTLIMVFTNWLIILQVFTIIIAYFVSENYVDKSKDNLQNIDKKYGQGCILFLVLGGLLSIFLKIYADDYNKNKNKNNEIAEIRNEDSLQIANDSINATYLDTLNTYSYSETYNDYSSIIDSVPQSQTIYDDVEENVKEKIIINFINSENNRDFNSMNIYLSNNMTQYWFFDFPSNQKIAKSYYSTWSKYESTNTQILEIIELSNYHFLIKTKYTYDENIKFTEINFIFDEYNKIESIY